MNTALQHYTEHFQQIAASLPGDTLTWLSQLRQQQLADFIKIGIPDRHHEHWKYTQPAFLAKQTFLCATPSPATLTAAVRLQDFSAHRLVFVNGYFSADLSTMDFSADKIQLLPLSSALSKHPEELMPYLQTHFANTANPFTHLNTAFTVDGVFLKVKKNAVFKRPIHVLFLTIPTATPSMSHPKNIVILEENSQLVLFEEHRSVAIPELHSTGVGHYKNTATQIVLKPNAQLDYYKLQNESKQDYHQASIHVQQAADSRFYSHNFSLGGQWARDDLTVSLEEKGAFCRLNGLYHLAGNQHVDHHTRIDHRSAVTGSEEYYKAVVDDQATAVFNGKVIVHPQAQQSKSQQTNRNLLLSPKAQVNTKPELEIYADDVQCAHGATTGQVDEEALFYLRSRGVDAAAATQLLVTAFIQEIIDRIQSQDIAAYVQSIITEKNL